MMMDYTYCPLFLRDDENDEERLMMIFDDPSFFTVQSTMKALLPLCCIQMYVENRGKGRLDDSRLDYA